MAVKISMQFKSDVDSILLNLLYLQLVILGFFGLDNILNKLLSVCFLIRIFMIYGKALFKKCAFWIILGLIVLYLASSILGDRCNWQQVYSNSLNYLYPVIYTWYVFVLYCRKKDLLETKMLNGFWVFNGTLIINIIAMIIQILYPHSINAVVVGLPISYYPDLISGFFAYASTHVVTIFTIFVLVYDLAYCNLQPSRSKKQLSMFLMGGVLIATVCISFFNDNKAFILFFLIAFITAFIIGSVKITRKWMSWVMVAIVCLGMLAMAYLVVPQINDLLNDMLFHKIDMIRSAYSLGTAANGSNERIAIVGYAFQEMEIWLLGHGFGSASIHQAGYLGFHHFGQSDLGTIILLGGIWFTMLLIYYYMRIFSRIVWGGRSGYLLGKISLFAVLMSLLFYTQTLGLARMMIAIILLILAYKMLFESYKNKDSLMKNNTTRK